MALKTHLIAVTLLAFTISGTALANDNQNSKRFEADVSQAQDITIDIPAGQVLVVGATGNKLLAEVKASCKQDRKIDRANCESVLNDLGWSNKMGKGAALSLIPNKITRYNDIQIDIKISVPNDKPLNIIQAAGELSIEGTSACLNANLNAGQLNLKLKESELGSAELHAKVGDAKLTDVRGQTRSGERSLLVGANLSHKGNGSCSAKADVMAGEVHLTLY
ncbi:hypothetical protein [Cellvibrio sp.]|uniref:hypothetical protein n=1 Tax=Cellvibrio sp. TaxID=1965322 RepID=UPI0039648AB9